MNQLTPRKPGDTHVVVRSTGKDTRASGKKFYPKGTIRWAGPIEPGQALINYVPAQAFRDDDGGFVNIAFEPDPGEIPA